MEVAGALAPPLTKPEAAMDGRGRDGGKWGNRDEAAKVAPLTPMMAPSLALVTAMMKPKMMATAKATARAMVRVTARATARAIGPSSWEYEHPL